jgi:hypothetical protein
MLPSIATGITQISAGNAKSKQDTYNAGIYNQQAQQIDVQKSIESTQYNRAIRSTRGSIIARTAGAGLTMSGSPMAVLVDNLTQLEMDKSIGQYNLEMQKRYASSVSSEYERRAKVAKTQGYTNAFSTILRGGFDTATRAGLFNMNTGGNSIVGGRGGSNTGIQATPYGNVPTWSPY